MHPNAFAAQSYDEALGSLCRGERSQAKELLCRAREFCPAFPDPLYLLARLEHEDGHPNRCREFLTALLKVCPQHVAGAELARQYNVPVQVRSEEEGSAQGMRTAAAFEASSPELESSGLAPEDRVYVAGAGIESEWHEDDGPEVVEAGVGELERQQMMDDLGLDPDDPHFGELAAEGLDPDEIDWDAEDYERD